ncbi:hypothetical protein A3860_31510 [Niastella vici]|uniref:HTH araC/xylS-type domain-containing protein n=1 Tax=Niastella vici TaxID=1703345 RepID=A0A1V9FTT3_9BACT|nr:AraC family transcriptional regulator [Niastella vici]OQP61789.1 hypothetical protein A3860_31510 [Niastella vici]
MQIRIRKTDLEKSRHAKAPSVIPLKDKDLETAREIKAFLDKTYSVHHSCDDLVKKFGMNKLKLKTAFKAVSNTSLHEYVTRVRIENAKVLLENTNRTIADIAKKVGLHKTNFIKQFKHYTGKTPTEWRNNPDLIDLAWERSGS